MIGVFELFGGGVLLLSAAIAVLTLGNFEPRRALLLILAQKYRWAAPDIIIAGDSLAAGCPFAELSRRPFAVLSLARGGATLQEIAAQLSQAREIAAQWVVIDGGLNDILSDDASPMEVERDFRVLLRRLGDGKKAIFTLMPHISDPAYAARIDAANERIAALCAQHGVAVLDLNPDLSCDGARRPEMTDDGLHFTPRANAVWIAATRRMTG